jgi:phosphatidylglycerol:prolipoprotein diacylglycerol transferase
MLGGVLGARVFYVVQKWNEFEGEGLARLVSILKLTEGGLVIYGGIFGGLTAGLWYCYRNHLSPRATADLIVPGFLIGYCFGRIGCLLHGCCFGGVCVAELPKIQFPQGSAAYQRQVQEGLLLGIHTSKKQLPAIVKSVDSGSPAERAGIKPGDELRAIEAAMIEPDKQSNPTSPPPVYVKIVTDNDTKHIFPEAMPAKSLPVHPSQIYSSINGLLLCLLMWFWQPVPKRDGIVFCTAIILYAVSRFLIEWIRSDEMGLLGTPLSIAQIVSLGIGSVGFIGLLILRKLPAGRVWKWC